MTGVRGVWLAALCGAILLTAAACGSGGGSVSLTVVPQLSELPADVTEATALDNVAAILVLRAAALGGEATVEVAADKTVTVEVKDVPEDQAADLLATTAWLRIRVPRVEEGNIVCIATDGTETAVAASEVTYPALRATRLPRCTLPDGSLGDIGWADATGEGARIDGSMIQTVALSTVDGPTLNVVFDPQGTAALEVISASLIGLPMGIFVDDELITGPTVSEKIPDGRISIAGISLRDARILRAQLLSGEMPVPVALADANE